MYSVQFLVLPRVKKSLSERAQCKKAFLNLVKICHRDKTRLGLVMLVLPRFFRTLYKKLTQLDLSHLKSTHSLLDHLVKNVTTALKIVESFDMECEA